MTTRVPLRDRVQWMSLIDHPSLNCSTVMNDRLISFIDEMRFVQLPLIWADDDTLLELEQQEEFILCLFLRPLLSPCWVAIRLHPTQRNSAGWKYKKSGRSSLQSTSADVDWLPRRWVRSPLSFHPNQSFSVRARMIILSSQYFSFDPLYSSFTKTRYTTVSFLYRRRSIDTFAVQDDLMVMNIVLYPPHVHKRNVLSSSCPSSRTTNPY